jgi:hypothetical protein
MVKISINGKPLNREFQNMAQALAFAYANGDCYGGKIVEIAQEGYGSKGGTGAIGGFTQADIDDARVEAVREAATNLAEIQNAMEAKDVEIAELKALLELMAADMGQENPDGTEVTNPKPVTETPLEEMNKEQLLAYALEANIDVNYTSSKEDILAAIQEAVESSSAKTEQGGKS